MSFPSTTLLLSLWLSSAIAYKLPLLDVSLLTHDDKAIQKPNNSPFGINYKWEWQSQARMDEGNLKLARLRREALDKKTNKGDVKQEEKFVPKVKPTEPSKKNVKQEEKFVPKVKPTEPPSQKNDKPEEKIPPKVKPTEPPSKKNVKEEEKFVPKVKPTEPPSKKNVKEEEKFVPKVKPTEPPSKKNDKPEEKIPPKVKPTEPPSKKNVKQEEKILPKVKPTEPLEEEFTDTTQYILETFTVALTKAKSMPLLNDETTPLVDPEKTTMGTGENLDEDETTTFTYLEQTSMKAKQDHDKDETTHADKSITQSGTLINEFTSIPTTSEKLSVLPSKTYNNQVHTTNSQDTSSKKTSTNEILIEDITATSSMKPPETSPTSKPDILHDLTTGHEVTTVRLSSSSSKPAAVTHITTPLEEKIHAQSIMKQCMLTILILAIVCTIFIISTIALAAKLSTMKQKNKLRHPITYTEMRCISSLLPDGDQQNKPPPKRLKTFTSTMEESDGDNTTLHSFLPEH
ncbi:P-selectin glycoprotein ligand 1 [Leptodactylus fuscus]|uniref:P-selectin glycoprotein ligand 1 n=1 Tax=Leptodactylus fuscus TaxID=238119 RepID=UPI003F4EE855